MGGLTEPLSAAALDPERAPYEVDDRFHDEAFEPDGRPRPHYRELIEALAAADPRGLAAAAAAGVERRDLRFGDAAGEAFVVDPVPRVFAAGEWSALEAGLVQRVRALSAFLADAYGERRIVAAGVVPARVIETADHFEPWMQGVPVRGSWIPVAGLDVVRDGAGRLLVLEDNVRTPSGLTYADVAGEIVGELLPIRPGHGASAAYAALAAALRAAAPEGVDDPSVVLLTDGPGNSAWFEHRRLAARLGLPLVTFDDLDLRGGRVRARVDGRTRPVDVIYRRTDDDRLRDWRGRPTKLASLLAPLRSGTVGMVNPPGTGVADDKLVHAYVEEMVRFYFGEEPLLRSVPTYDLAEPATLGRVLGRLGEIVVKPRSDYGGRGVVVGPHARRDDLAQVARMIAARPDRSIAQETIPLSRHPTVCAGRLEPRHVDLRAFVLTSGDDVHVVRGGLTRVALDRGALVVNSSQNGGGKDTWVLR